MPQILYFDGRWLVVQPAEFSGPELLLCEVFRYFDTRDDAEAFIEALAREAALARKADTR